MPEIMYEPICDLLRQMLKNSALDLVKCNMILNVHCEKKQLEIMKGYHESITNRRGINETEMQLRERFNKN